MKLIFIVLGFGVLMFLLQWMLCGSKKPVSLKVLPAILLLLGSGTCGVICRYLNNKEQTLIFVLVFLLGIALAGMLIGAAVAWCIQLIVRNAQKSK